MMEEMFFKNFCECEKRFMFQNTHGQEYPKNKKTTRATTV